MKKLVLSVLVMFSLTINHLHAQTWTPVLSVPVTTGIFKNIYFSDNLHGWAAGTIDGQSNVGMIYATTDGGATWAEQSPGTMGPLFDVFFFDNNTGWAVGKFGSVYKTIDGGANWTSAATISNSPELQKVHFSSLTNGYVIGTNNMFSSTTDGGATWTNGGSVGNDKYDCLFITSQIGITCGTSQVGKTTNGGTTWTQSNLGAGNWRALDTTSTNNIWVVGDEGYMTSNDQGATWSSINTFSSGTNGTDIKFLNTNTGWVTQSGSTIIKTVDGGTTWTNDFTTSNVYFSGIYPINENNVFVTAYKPDATEAYIYRYTCAGATAPASLGWSGTVTASPCVGTTFSLTAFSPQTNSMTWTVPIDWTISSYSGVNNHTINGVVGNDAGQITLTATNSCGLTSAPFNYNVTPQTNTVINPTFINYVSGDNCIGGNSSFQTTPAPSGTEWVWSSNNWDFVNGNPISVNPYGTFITDETDATVSVYLQNACGGVSSTFTETFSLTLDVPLPAPVITLSGNNLSTTTVANEYCWTWVEANQNTGDSCIIGSAGMNFTPLVTGDYTLTVSTINGCKSESNVMFATGVLTNVLENSLSNVQMHPNPTNGLVSISNITAGTVITISDASGRIIATQTSDINTTIDLSNQENGVYFVSLQNTDGSNITKKLIVRK